MEANLTRATIDVSNNDNLAVAEYVNADEAITELAKARNEMEIDTKEEHKTEAYQETMNTDIENIEKTENSHKHYTKQWRKIYEVIQQEFFDETDIFQRFF